MPQDYFIKFQKQFKNELPFVCFRKPGEKEVKGVLQRDARLHRCSELDKSGFIFAPFEDIHSTVLIPFDEVLVETYKNEALTSIKTKFSDSSETTRMDYVSLIEKSLLEIKNNSFKKVVLSRAIDLTVSIKPFEVFMNILNTYDNAFCYLWYHPKVGLWLGATPELLLTVKDGNLKSMSLAGTIPYNSSKKPGWGQKEKEEQELVTAHIKANLETKLEDINIGPQESIRAGELWHLRTLVYGRIKDVNLKGLVEELHPTPAVCGLPVKESASFIKENEGYDREYYAGFLGEMNLDHPLSASLYVNLRCLKMTNRGVRIFVGGGITERSIPEKEWLETVHKSKTMANMLHF
ncbi:MAG: chorismate-binding protein [Eudoraea sp.]